jgi:hypothetical protein
MAGAAAAMAGGQALDSITNATTNFMVAKMTNASNQQINQANINQQNAMQTRFESNLTDEGLPKYLANNGGSNLGQFIPHNAQMFSGKNFMMNALPGLMRGSTSESNQSLGRTNVLGELSRVPPTPGLSSTNRGFNNFTSAGQIFLDGRPNNQPGTLVSKGLLPTPSHNSEVQQITPASQDRGIQNFPGTSSGFRQAKTVSAPTKL